MRNKKNFRFSTIALAFTMLASTCCFPLTTDVVVAKEATQMGGIRGADDDTSANQTFDDSKIEGADSNTLSNLLKELPEKVENNSKVNNNMNDLGDKSGVESGKIKEITEFGGWTAIDGGKFAIAKKTQYGFFPIGLINVTRAGGKDGGAETAFVQESVLDKTNDYTLLLGKAVTGANRTEPAYNGTPYKHTGEWKEIARNVKGFKGIEKTFKAYSPATGSNVKVGFKIGYTGDIDGKKAKYKVEVLAHTETREWKNIYTKEFYPTDNDAEVKAAKDGNVSAFNVTGMTKDQAEEKMKLFNIVPNGTVGTFTSNDIQLPKGATEYKVKISIADQDRLGMSYQSKFELYALPISGADFNIAQDTKQLAKYLFTQIYNKLLDEKAEDIKNMTPESIKAYEEALNAMKDLSEAKDVKSNQDYINALTNVEGKKEALKLMVNPPQNPIEVANPAQLTAEEKGKVREAIKAANQALNLTDNEIEVKEDGSVVVTKDNKTANVPANKAVTKKLMVNPPQQAVEVENPAQLSDTEKQAVKDAIKAANKSLNLTDNDIEVKEDGSVVVTKDNKTANVPANQAVVQKGATPSDNNNIHNDGYDYYPWFNLVYGGFDFSNTNTSSITNSAPKKDTLEYVFTIDKKYYEVVKNGVSTMHDMDVAPVIKNNRTMLPLRYVAEAIGAEVKWDAMTRTATFIKGSITTKIQIDTDEILLSNGTTIHMDSKPLVVNGRILIPVVNVANVFGLTNGNTKDSLDKDIEWNSENRTATIYMER